jgi:hypothetical protein
MWPAGRGCKGRGLEGGGGGGGGATGWMEGTAVAGLEKCNC